MRADSRLLNRSQIYKGPLKWPKILQVDSGREFMGAVTKEMEKHDVRIRRGNVNVHRNQGIVERFNRSLSERLFSFQYSQEMNLKSGERSTEWVKRLPEVVSALNREKTRLTEKRPVDAIKEIYYLKRGFVREELMIVRIFLKFVWIFRKSKSKPELF